MVGERGLVVFLSDYGLRDPYVVQVKATLDRFCPGLRLFDLTHEVDPFCITCGAYAIDSSIEWFPPGTVFLAVVDPGVGGGRRSIIVRALSRWFVGPDNGLFTPVLIRDSNAKVWVIRTSSIPVRRISHTFHGRDIFAPVAALLACGENPDSLGDQVNASDLVRLDYLWSLREGSSLCAKVLYVDRFGNLALSFKGDPPFQLGSRHKVTVGGRRTLDAFYVTSFSHVREGEVAVYVNSFGYLEVAVYMGRASEELGARIGDVICISQEG